MSPNASINLAQEIGRWLKSEDAREFFRKSKRSAGIALGDVLGLDEQDRSTKPAIVQARAGIVAAAMHHPVSIHLFMIWGLLGVMWTAAIEHPKRSEAREEALQRIFNPEEYQDLDKEIAEDDSGEPQVLKIYNRNIRAFRHGPRKARTSHWCLQVGEHYYELRDPGSLTQGKTEELKPLSEKEELFNTDFAGARSKGVWFLITKGKTFDRHWEELYESTTFHSHRRIRARAKHIYEQHFADSNDKSQYNLWVNNCQTFATLIAIAITEPKESRAIVDKTLTSKSTFWLSAVGSVFASIYFYWCKKVIEEVRPHLEKRINSSAFSSYAYAKLADIDKRMDYYYLHPQVMLQRQQLLNQALGPKGADRVKRVTSGGIEKMKEISAQKHVWRHQAQDKYREWKTSDSSKLKDHQVLEIEDEEEESGTGTKGVFEETHTTDDPCMEDDPDYVETEARDTDPENKGCKANDDVEANTSATDKPEHFDRIVATKQQIHDKKHEMKSRIKKSFRQWRSAKGVATATDGGYVPDEDGNVDPKGSIEEVAGVDSLKGLALTDNLGSDESARDVVEARSNDEDQGSVDHDAMNMATAEMMAQLLLEDSSASSESPSTVPSMDGGEVSRLSSTGSDEMPSAGLDIGITGLTKD